MQKILSFFRTHWIRVFIVALILSIAGVVLYNNHTAVPDWTTSTVESGTVSKIISVSGTMNATKSVELSFPVSGTVESVHVHEGDVVTRGTELISLERQALKAEYQDASAALLIAQADQAELISGIRGEERAIASTKVAIAEEELIRVTKEHTEKVDNAYRTLLTTDLEARPANKDTESTPPIITGTYTCGEGTYTLSIFRSSAKSGYSYRLSGLEAGTYTAYTDTPGALGTCGLSIQFLSGESYGSSSWTIRIPNTESPSYSTNDNAYILAQTAKTNAITSAEQNLLLAKQTEALSIARPREEAVTREQARVLQAESRVQKILSELNDRVLLAPFDGIVSTIGPLVGETVGAEPVLSLVSKDVFELTALVPEIDITKIAIGQKADIIFDARTDETHIATITFISPIAKEIGGVSYFETKLMLDTPSSWLQSGLNADIDIVIERREQVTRVPKRFLISDEGTDFILVPNGNTTKRVPVTILFEGNDGYVEINGVEPGVTVIAP
jgi:HlyD family secretion protein